MGALVHISTLPFPHPDCDLALFGGQHTPFHPSRKVCRRARVTLVALAKPLGGGAGHSQNLEARRGWTLCSSSSPVFLSLDGMTRYRLPLGLQEVCSTRILWRAGLPGSVAMLDMLTGPRSPASFPSLTPLRVPSLFRAGSSKSLPFAGSPGLVTKELLCAPRM